MVGALREFPVFSSNSTKLMGSTGLRSKIVNNRVVRNALKNFTKTISRTIRALEYGRGSEVKINVCRISGETYLRLGSLMGEKSVTKPNYSKMMKVCRWFCDQTAGLCDDRNWTDTCEHVDCRRDRDDLFRKEGCAAACLAIG